jgi:hypothetical protein
MQVSDNASGPAMVGGLANDAHLNFLCPTREPFQTLTQF